MSDVGVGESERRRGCRGFKQAANWLTVSQPLAALRDEFGGKKSSQIEILHQNVLLNYSIHRFSPKCLYYLLKCISTIFTNWEGVGVEIHDLK